MENKEKVMSDIINALSPLLINGSNTLVSYKRTFAKVLADFVADVDQKSKNNDITQAETRNLLRMWETMISVSIAAEDVIETSTKAQAANAVLKVVQNTINSLTGFSINLF